MSYVESNPFINANQGVYDQIVEANIEQIVASQILQNGFPTGSGSDVLENRMIS